MPKFNFHMGMTLRCYGNVEVEAESVETALPMLTADYLAEHIDITETTTDSGQDLAIIDVSDAGTGETLEDYGGHSLPSPYDAPDASEIIRTGRELAALWESRPVNVVRIEEVTKRFRAAIAKAEGRA